MSAQALIAGKITVQVDALRDARSFWWWAGGRQKLCLVSSKLTPRRQRIGTRMPVEGSLGGVCLPALGAGGAP